VSKLQSGIALRAFSVLLGLGLLAHLVLRTGPRMIWTQIHAVGWGVAVIIVLGGLAHLVKTWAWRLTFRSDIGGVSWRRSFGMRLISEAIGQVGIAGKFLGEGVRVSMLGDRVTTESGISSATLDSGLYTLSSACVTILGMACVLLLAPISAKWRFYACLFSLALLAFVVLNVLATAKQWRVLSYTMRAIGRLPRLQNWLLRKEALIKSVEENVLNFRRESPRAFWGSLTLNFLCHALAALEVYVVLRFMGLRVGLLGALMLEGLTKLINSAGAFNPGNVGTYEAGNVLVTKLLGVTTSSGLTLALCRRARAIFWAVVGAFCLLLMKRLPENSSDWQSRTPPRGIGEDDSAMSAQQKKEGCQSAIIFANCERYPGEYLASLAQVGTLPVLLRAILTVQSAGADRIVACVPAASAQHFKLTLRQTGRLPSSVEWREIGPETDLWSVVTEVAAVSHRTILLFGNRIYQPGLLQTAAEWSGTRTLALATSNELAGIHVISQSAALGLGTQASSRIQNLPELRSDIPIEIREVPGNSWHTIVTAEDLRQAETKLDTWLVKATDGVFARMNRRVSIPISRQLIKLPVTPNMVSLLVLKVSFASGFFFARGGYWYTLLGAALSVFSSILDGCDGEVARLKLQSTKFGCWLETVCDYLYYLFVFGGMALGLTRTFGNRNYLAWGGLLCFGAVMSFLVVSYSRQRLAGAQPEKLLAVWQKKAESRLSNPLLFLGRHTEFIIRRCFFPYALLFFALINMLRFAFIATAIGANIVWIVALYSAITFSRGSKSCVPANTPAVLVATGD
jgi:phosphatidylglycerophosphate synthase